MKVLRKYLGFNDTYTKEFEDFFSILDALLHARLTHQTIDPATL